MSACCSASVRLEKQTKNPCQSTADGTVVKMEDASHKLKMGIRFLFLSFNVRYFPYFANNHLLFHFSCPLTTACQSPEQENKVAFVDGCWRSDAAPLSPHRVLASLMERRVGCFMLT